MPQLSQRARQLAASPIRKLQGALDAHAAEATFHQVNIGQPDVHTPAPLLEAIRRFQPEVVSYGPASGTWACRDAAAAYHSRWCPALRGKDVAVTTGGSEALLFAFAAVCDPGDEILVPEPYYANYNGFARMVGATVRPLATSIGDGFALPDDAALDAAITERTRAFLFSNPGNPTGAIYNRAELERVVAWARRRGLFVIADEVYRRIWFDEQPPSALELADAADSVLVIDSMSKTYSACGLRLGFLISRNAELMERVERLGQARLGPQPLAQQVAIAALGLDDGYYAEIRGIYRRRIDALFGALASVPGVTAPRPRGAFYTMLGLPVDDADRFALWLVEQFRDRGESVVVAPGSGFYADPSRGTDEVRVAAVIEEHKLTRVVELLALALQRYPGRTEG
jgi:aspartate aminotransferase